MQDQIENTLRGKRLAFLVGAPRSGTTWLQLLLSRSPAVATAQETDLFNIFLRPMVAEWIRFRKTREPLSLSEVLGEEDFRKLLLSISGFVFARIAETKPSAPVILEKTPNHVQCWREILDLWPEAHFIHIVRDPRSVVASRRAAVKDWGAGWGTSRISAIAEMWVSFVSNGREIRAATPNYQEVFYEQLISNGPNIVMQVLSKLGVPSTMEECCRYFDECNIEKLKAGTVNNSPFDLARAGKYRFRTGKTDSWQNELSKWEIALVERLAGPLMSELGFEPSQVGRTLRTVAGLSCAGSDLIRDLQRRCGRLIPNHPSAADLYGRLS
jgi:hypothetical protein